MPKRGTKHIALELRVRRFMKGKTKTLSFAPGEIKLTMRIKERTAEEPGQIVNALLDYPYRFNPKKTDFLSKCVADHVKELIDWENLPIRYILAYGEDAVKVSSCKPETGEMTLDVKLWPANDKTAALHA